MPRVVEEQSSSKCHPIVLLMNSSVMQVYFVNEDEWVWAVKAH